MAIQFARIEIVGRSSGGNACCRGAYNARAIVKDNKTNVTYNFKHKGDNVYHTVLLPEHADKRFNSLAEFMNEVEHCEKRKDSQLLKDIVLALPDDKELTLQDRINITHLLIEKRAWVKEGLGVQVDIHEPHDGEKNWHAHLLVTTRRFTEDGQSFGLKATDLNPEFKKVGGKSFAIPEAEQIHEDLRDIINDYFKMLGLENRVDAISQLGQEHVGPVRMRSVLNKAVLRNEERREANIEQLNSAEALLERVVANKSIFTANDIKRELKCINDADRRNTLLNEALGHNSIVHLSDHNGNDTGLVTTKEVRAEEQKILRLAGYVANGENVITAKCNSEKDNNGLLSQINSNSNLTQEQTDALKYLLNNESGVRILQGRAGTGKSYVLGKVCSISESMGVNVIGIAPTHKARTELSKVGYEQNDTVKGMLFKLHNGRFSLPKNTLIVVDEAGMVANSDYQELMRIAATRKCNVILAGDSRQLSSVSRGGMFEVLADKFGSCEIANIQRQKENWGREVAMCLSRGDARTGLSILQQEGRIEWGVDSQESMRDLLGDWQNSRIPLADKIIIAVENKNVDALNAGARQYLKASGYLVGDEYSIAGREFMRGDRVLITKTDKSLGVTNGDIGTIEYADSNKFVLSLGSGKDAKHVEFDPNTYSGFRHGYATTVFKAQGASIKDVYVFHDGFSGMRNSYVALSRHVEELKLYANENATGGMDALVKQMSYKLDKGCSLAYISANEYKAAEEEKEIRANCKGFDKALLHTYDFFKNNMTKIADKYLPASEYYNYKEPAAKYEPVSKVLDQEYAVEAKEAVGDDRSNYINNNYELHNNVSSALKENTGLALGQSHAQAQNSNIKTNRNLPHVQQRFNEQKDHWDREHEQLKSEIKFKAEAITRGLLGDPNRKLSNGKELRYGEHGKLAIRITGERAGTWYDFSESKGGDMFHLVQDVRKMSFKDSADYLKSSVGMSSSTIRPNLQLVYDNDSADATKAHLQEKAAKIKYANKLYEKSKPLGSQSVASNYLQDHRGINSHKLSQDIKTTGIYDKKQDQYLPALIAYARDKDGNITGGQYTLLDKDTNGKADTDIQKRSFGSIRGAFIDVGNNNQSDNKANNKTGNRITIIAEGLETALSVNQALRKHNNIIYGTKVLCSLGISNIKNYSPSKAEKIIIAADNDGENAITAKTIENAKAELQAKGAIVEIVRPDEKGDFNDVLTSGRGGSYKIAKTFKPTLIRYSTKSLKEYFATKNQSFTLSEDEKHKIEFISKFGINEKKIINAYRACPEQGRLELDKVCEPIQIAHKNVISNKNIIQDINLHGGNVNDLNLTLELSYKYNDPHLARRSWSMDKHIWSLREKHHLLYQIKEFQDAKDKARTPKEAMVALIKEQQFLAGLHQQVNDEDHSQEVINSIQKAHEAQQLGSMTKLHEAARYAYKEKMITPNDLTDHLKLSHSVNDIYNNINQICYKRHCQILTKHCNEIQKGDVVEHQGHKFDCIAEYLEHWKDNVHHDMLPVKQMNKQIERVHEQQRDRGDDHHMSLDM